MRHILRRTSLLLVAFGVTAFVVGVPIAASDTSLQNVTLTCSDGTNMTTSLDTAAVTALTDAVNDMALFPAGDPPLSCSLITAPVLLGPTTSSSTGLSYRPRVGKSPIRTHGSSRIGVATRKLSAGNQNYDYAVGGGDQFQFPIASPCKINFSFSMRTPAGVTAEGAAQGSFDESVPAGCIGPQSNSHLMVNITCLSVSGNEFNAHGTVTKATGQFANDGFTVTGNAYITGDDNGGAPIDELGVSPTPTSGVSPCFGVFNKAEDTHGRVNVHDAG